VSWIEVLFFGLGVLMFLTSCYGAYCLGRWDEALSAQGSFDQVVNDVSVWIGKLNRDRTDDSMTAFFDWWDRRRTAYADPLTRYRSRTGRLSKASRPLPVSGSRVLSRGGSQGTRRGGMDREA